MPKKSKKVPQFLQGVLWSVPVEKLDLQKDQVYIINQVLAYGTLPMWQWLFSEYNLKTIKQVFVSQPIRDYTSPRFYLLKDAVFNLKDQSLAPQKYVRDFFTDSRPTEESYF